METLQIIGYSQDYRTNTHIVYAQIDIPEYLQLVGDSFDEFGIQRKREHHMSIKNLPTSMNLNKYLL